MAVVKGIRERVHLPIYDSLFVEPEKQVRDVESSSTLKFFVNVQGKTKLQTNMNAAGLLSHENTFEARAMRVVISDLPPEFPEEVTGSDEGYDLTAGEDAQGNPLLVFLQDKGAGNTPRYVAQKSATPPADTTFVKVTADLELGLNLLMELLADARKNDGVTTLGVGDEEVTLLRGGTELTDEAAIDVLEAAGAEIEVSEADLEGMIKDIKDEKKQPPPFQLRPNDGAGTLVSQFVYNTVTTFYVGEKIMIQMPTWFFPAGAGPHSQTVNFLSHGEPNPTATFRFAEPIFIDRQQNFRVEIEVPDSDVLKVLQRTYGPLSIWVVLDGYMTRDVQ